MINQTELKDTFISYGRKESLAFGKKIFDSLTNNGITAWFDHVNIPKGDDFQQRIDNGIESSHNFIYIIAPHANNSEYCRKEIDLAVKLGKRIIPILHIERDLHQVPPAVGKINWIYAREQESDQPLESWQEIDPFEKALTELVELIETEKEYVHEGTEFLQRALAWQRHQYSDDDLLTGQERARAEKWLLREFVPPAQPPCRPTKLQCDFICQSRKNAENLMTDVFISYSAEDKTQRKEIALALSRHLITTWVHDQDIRKGSNFDQAIREGIEQASYLVFLITKNSVVSEWCLNELTYAEELNKHIIPLRLEKVEEEKLPKEIKTLQHIDFWGNQSQEDFDHDIDILLKVFNTDRNYFFSHKTILVQALKWQRQEKNPSMLIRGFYLQNAQAWQSIGMKRADHRPLAVHNEFIDESAAQAGKLSVEVFVSYSRNDSDFARKLNNELQLNGKSTWFDQDNIVEGSDFQQEIYRGIETSENFLFLLSPKSVRSPYCSDEVEYAHKQGKRILTLLVEEVLPSEMPAKLAAVQWIDASKDFAIAFAQLIRALNTDREYVQKHNEIQNSALEWENKANADALLMRGIALEEAESWMTDAAEHKTKPFPTELQKSFLAKSQDLRLHEQRREKERKRMIIGIITVSSVLVICVLVMIAAIYAFRQASESEAQAQREKNNAQKEKLRADKEKREADIARKKAEVLSEIADSLKLLAENRADKEVEKRKAANKLLNAKMSRTEKQRKRILDKINKLKTKLEGASLEKKKKLHKKMRNLEDSLDQLSKIVSPYTLNQGFTELERFGFRTIDAALSWPDGRDKVYFFFRNKYIRWDLRLNKMDGGYPKETKKGWPGITFDRIDAAFFLHHNQKAYFFRNDEYIRYDLKADRADEGYPKKITQKTWPGLTFRKIDSAISWEPIDGAVYFTSGNQYARYSPERDVVEEGYPYAINNEYWPEITFKEVHAALFWNNDISFFFNKNEFHRWDNEYNRAY